MTGDLPPAEKPVLGSRLREGLGRLTDGTPYGGKVAEVLFKIVERIALLAALKYAASATNSVVLTILWALLSVVFAYWVTELLLEPLKWVFGPLSAKDRQQRRYQLLFLSIGILTVLVSAWLVHVAREAVTQLAGISH
jgi:hypothetical protein